MIFVQDLCESIEMNKESHFVLVGRKILTEGKFYEG